MTVVAVIERVPPVFGSATTNVAYPRKWSKRMGVNREVHALWFPRAVPTRSA